MSQTDFEMFGQQHLVTMFVIAATAVALPLGVKRRRSVILTKRVAIVMCAVLLTCKAVEPFYLVAQGRPWADALPLHMCDIGAICAAIMLLNRNYFLYELTYFWGFGGTLQAILTPSVEGTFPDMRFWFYFLSHGLIIVIAIYATLLFDLRPSLRSIVRVFSAALVLAAVMAPINWILESNYMYLCDKPPVASILDYLGPWPWYLLALLTHCLALFLRLLLSLLDRFSLQHGSGFSARHNPTRPSVRKPSH